MDVLNNEPAICWSSSFLLMPWLVAEEAVSEGWLISEFPLEELPDRSSATVGDFDIAASASSIESNTLLYLPAK